MNAEWSTGTGLSRTEEALAGVLKYDALDRASQADVRAVWDVRVAYLLSVFDRFDGQQPTDPWPEGDEQGRVVWRHPVERERPQGDPAVMLPVDLTVLGDAPVFTTSVPRDLVGQLGVGDPVLIVDDAVLPQAFWVLEVLDGGRAVRVTKSASATAPTADAGEG